MIEHLSLQRKRFHGAWVLDVALTPFPNLILSHFLIQCNRPTLRQTWNNRSSIPSRIIRQELDFSATRTTEQVGDVYADVEIDDFVFRFFISVSAGLGVAAVELHVVGGGVVELGYYEGGEVGG